MAGGAGSADIGHFDSERLLADLDLAGREFGGQCRLYGVLAWRERWESVDTVAVSEGLSLCSRIGGYCDGNRGERTYRRGKAEQVGRWNADDASEVRNAAACSHGAELTEHDDSRRGGPGEIADAGVKDALGEVGVDEVGFSDFEWIAAVATSAASGDGNVLADMLIAGEVFKHCDVHCVGEVVSDLVAEHHLLVDFVYRRDFT